MNTKIFLLVLATIATASQSKAMMDDYYDQYSLTFPDGKRIECGANNLDSNPTIYLHMFKDMEEISQGVPGLSFKISKTEYEETLSKLEPKGQGAFIEVISVFPYCEYLTNPNIQQVNHNIIKSKVEYIHNNFADYCEIISEWNKLHTMSAFERLLENKPRSLIYFKRCLQIVALGVVGIALYKFFKSDYVKQSPTFIGYFFKNFRETLGF